MGKAGCWMIAWGIESGNEQILKRAHKGYKMRAGAPRAAAGRSAAGIKNWGYFIIGLPGETVETIRETIDFAKELPLDIALFHVAAPYPGHAVLLRGGGERLVPPGHAVGRSRHGPVAPCSTTRT